jgi:hypothetical protein
VCPDGRRLWLRRGIKSQQQHQRQPHADEIRDGPRQDSDDALRVSIGHDFGDDNRTGRDRGRGSFIDVDDYDLLVHANHDNLVIDADDGHRIHDDHSDENRHRDDVVDDRYPHANRRGAADDGDDDYDHDVDESRPGGGRRGRRVLEGGEA